MSKIETNRRAAMVYYWRQKGVIVTDGACYFCAKPTYGPEHKPLVCAECKREHRNVGTDHRRMMRIKYNKTYYEKRKANKNARDYPDDT